MSVKVVMVSQAPTETHFLPIPPRSLWVTLDKRPSWPISGHAHTSVDYLCLP